MQVIRFRSSWLGLLAGAVCACAAGRAAAQPSVARTPATAADRARTAALVPLELLPAHLREGARLTLEKATLFSRGPAEAFACNPALYYWFLDHPDRAVAGWRRLGAQCLSISDRGAGRFGWSDEAGSDVVWETVYRTPNLRIWYAEGKIKPGALLPTVPIKAVVVLRHAESCGRDGAPLMQHQADMFLRTDSAAAALASKLFGATAPRLAEQCLSQLEMFFAGLAWYVHTHPDRADAILSSARTGRQGPSGN